MAVGSFPHEVPTPLFMLKPRLGRCYHCKRIFEETDTFVEMSNETRTRLYHHRECFNAVAERLYRRAVCCSALMAFKITDAALVSSPS